MTSWGKRFDLFALRHPVFMAGFTSGSRYILADLLGQSNSEKLNSKQVASFALFGAGYGAGPAYFIYNKLYPHILDNSRVFATAALDISLHTPFIYFPAFYFAKAAVMTDSNSIEQIVHASYADWKANFREDLKFTVAFWLPAHVVNFYFVPLHYRVPTISCIGFFWSIGLSLFRGSEAKREA